MIDTIMDFWFLIMFFTLIPLNFRALMAIDFSKMFRYNSTWQIRLITVFLSIIISFLVSFALVYSFKILYYTINK